MTKKYVSLQTKTFMAKTEQMKKKNYLPPRIRSYEFMAELGFTGSQVVVGPPEIRTERYERSEMSGDSFWGDYELSRFGDD